MQGIWNGGLYCPVSPPNDTPMKAQRRKGSGYPWIEWDREDLPMRNDVEFRRVAKQVARRGATDKQRSRYGVKGLSILSRLSSIDFPRSFPPDAMHLWFENVIPDLVKHWRGKYRVEVLDISDGASEADDESSQAENFDDRYQSSNKRKLTANSQRSKNKKRKKTGSMRVKQPKAVVTGDEYNIRLQTWEKLSRQIADSAPTMPSLFGPLLRNFIEHIHEMTAAEWQLFTFTLAPVYLKDVLPDEDYQEFISLVEAIQLACDYLITRNELVEIDQRIQRFSRYYEQRYYRMEWARLKVCLPVFHQILHVPQALRWTGPMYVCSQWAMERLCGTFAGMAKSRVSTNRNLSNTITMLEQRSTLVYVIDHQAPNSSDEDSDGNIRLSNFLVKRLAKSRPPDAPHMDSNYHPTLHRGVDVVLFVGPSSFRALTTHERMCVKSFILRERGYQNYSQDYELEGLDEERLGAEADSFNIPSSCRIFRSALFNTTERGDPYIFKSTSSTAQRSNQSRSTAFICYDSYPRLENHNPRSKFGEVIFFFTLTIPEDLVCGVPILDPKIRLQIREKERGPVRDRQENEILLAFIRHFSVCKDGKLLYRRDKGVLQVIVASDICELIGLLWKDKTQYVVRKQGALFG